ncbi:hypothetical protein AgCh_035917 [Apium graveolens]
MKNGYFIDIYVDRVVDKAIDPASQTQPHVIVRPRTSFFEGVDFQLKRKFVMVQEVKQQLDKKKLANDAYEQEKNRLKTYLISRLTKKQKEEVITRKKLQVT